MGAWGTAIFSDDVACDVRSDYIDLINCKVPDEEAEKIILKEYHEYIGAGDEDEFVFWCALALCEWNKGRLSEYVKSTALKFLGIGEDMDRWENEKERGKRIKVLEELKKKLLSPIPARSKPRSVSSLPSPWKEGDILAAKLLADDIPKEYRNKYVVLRVLEIRREPYSRLIPQGPYWDSETLIMYRWCGDEIPSASFVENLPVLTNLKGEYIEERINVEKRELKEQEIHFIYNDEKNEVLKTELKNKKCQSSLSSINNTIFSAMLYNRLLDNR